MLGVLALTPFVVATLPAAAAPLTLTQQGRLLDADGTPLNTEHTLTSRLVDGSGVPLFTDVLTVPVEDGYYAVVLGADPETRWTVTSSSSAEPRCVSR